MTTTKKALVFLVLTFVTSWAGLWLGLRGPAVLSPLSWIALLSPAFAAIACSVAFERGQRLKSLGLRFKPNWWWLGSFLIACGLTALTVIVTASFSPHKLVGLEGMAEQLAGLQNEQYSDATLYLLQLAGSIALNIVLYTTLFGLSEELGWRGYLYHIWRRFGFWRYSLAVGLIWGMWHLPMNYFVGLNYPTEHRVVGLFMFPIFTVCLSVLMTLVRDRGRSVWAACILHGTVNSLAVLTAIAVAAPEFPWTVSGISGIGAMLIGVILTALFQRRDNYRESAIPRPSSA